MSKIVVMPGTRFGKLTVISETEQRNGKRYMICKCDCGSECIVSLTHLRTGHTKSCGCMAKNNLKDRRKDLSNMRFGKLVAIEPTDKRRKSSVIWRCICDCGKETFVESENLLGGTTRSCGCFRIDVRKENMAKAIHFVEGTCIEKIANQRETASNTSGHRGVTKRPNGTWRAEITFKGKRYDLGTHKTFEEAVQARLKGEQMYTDFLEEYYSKQSNI